jgi:hypothetical protein
MLGKPDQTKQLKKLKVNKICNKKGNNLNCLKLLMFNARSIRNKFRECAATIIDYNIDIAAISETWLKTIDRDFIGEYAIPGYKIFNRDRSNKVGGGVMFYVKNNINATQFTTNENNNNEVLGIDIGSEIKYRIILTYRPPNNSVINDQSLYQYLSQLINNKVGIILGDFNCPEILNVETTNADSARLLEFSIDNFLTQWVTNPTRGDNTLDLIFTTDDNNIQNIEIRDNISSSDHKSVYFELITAIKERANNQFKVLNYKKADYMKLNRQLMDIDVTEIDDTDTAWNAFKSDYFIAINKCIPTKTIQTRTRRPTWFTKEVIRAINKRDKAYKILKNNNNQRNLDRYNKLKREIKSIIRHEKRTEEIKLSRDININVKKFFSYVESRKTIKSTINEIHNKDGHLVSSDKEKANIFNEYFSSVFSNSNNLTNNSDNTNGQRNPELSQLDITENDIIKYIDKMNKFKSPGPDNFVPQVIKEVKYAIVTNLRHIFQLSINNCEIPTDWKLSNVIPIPKKGNKLLPENYRPISLTSIICKILESIICEKINDFVESNNIITKNQHGFRRNRSCSTNLLEFYGGVYSEFDEGKAIDIIYLDFKKAFDKVNHKLLIDKIRSIGIKGKISNWIENWLKNRKQRVMINGATSEWADVTSGIVQGSCMGPNLYILYSSDLDADVTCKISTFADDTKIGNRADNMTNAINLQKDLDKIVSWANKWEMSFNYDKCKVMHIGTNNVKYNYLMLGRQLKITDEERDLGIKITSNLKWTKHCIEIENKCNRILGYIKRTFNYKNKEIVINLYKSLVLPHLEFAVTLWAPNLEKDINRLERVQARATKLIPDIRHKSYTERLKLLGLMTLEQRRDRIDLIQTYKIINHIDNVSPNDYFEFCENPTRNHGYKLKLKRYNTSILGNFFTYRISQRWNNLPRSLVHKKTLTSFTAELDKYILNSSE